MGYFLLALYGLCLLGMLVYSLGQLHLAWYYRKAKKEKPVSIPELQQWPMVTIQLPVFNEKYVIERLIKKVAEIDYPSDKLEIQVLDDSTDETTALAEKTILEVKKANPNASIELVRRPERTGFKAGALAYGLAISKGEFLAIFDADFLPEKDFLRNTIPHFFRSEKVGVVQTRWGHLNKSYSWLTRLQAFGLDAHFSIEQKGRKQAGSFINFNGTAGVWRKSCIETSGGWQPDTLTEDLDLSYRAQLKGWEFTYLEEVVAPAELPVLMPAIKSQQYRWNKGAAESARKHLGDVFRSSFSMTKKLHATLHLLNSSIFILLLATALLSFPVVILKQTRSELEWIINLGSLFLVGFFSVGAFYWYSVKYSQELHKKRYFLLHFPLFLIVSMGMSFHNAWAVAEGWLGFKTPFIRTPKFNIVEKEGSSKGNAYMRFSVSWMNLFEILLCLYFATGVAYGIWVQDGGMLIFHAMLSIGFGWVCWESVKGNLKVS